MVTARTVALRVIVASDRGGWTDRLLKRELRRANLDSREAALCTRLCYGVVQNRTLLDFWLAPHSKIPLGKLESRVLGILRLGAYQALFLDKIPDFAGVSACVDMARAASGERAAGFVNAVLRALLRSPCPAPAGEARERLSLLYSRPAWQVEAYLETLGEGETESLLAADNTAPPLWVHVNPLRATVEHLRDALAAEGVATDPHPWLPGCLSLRGAGDIERLASWKQGLFLVADPAARLAVMAADPPPGAHVIDGCAAPGGKAFFAAMHMLGRGVVSAFDIHPHKLSLLRQGRDRLGLDNIVRIGLKDAGVFDPTLADSADLVLADLPCSGLGIVRKKPDIRFKTAGSVSGLPLVQRRLLLNLSRYVKPGGKLLYSTCTLRQAENEEVADAFLRECPGFLPQPFVLPCQGGDAPGGRLTVWPHIHGTDGFFICLLQRKQERKGVHYEIDQEGHNPCASPAVHAERTD